VNGDGVPDLVFTSRLTGAVSATLLVQNAAERGSFLQPASLALPGNATAVTMGDLNGDGRQDIVPSRLVMVNGISATAPVSSTSRVVALSRRGKNCRPPSRVSIRSCSP
jgi:hypothetical protein